MATRPGLRMKVLLLASSSVLCMRAQDVVQTTFLNATDHPGILRFHALTQLMEPHTPRTAAYQGAATAMRAEVEASVWAKWRCCKDGMRLLDQAVKQAPADPEVRFLRFVVADATPGFLGFRTNLQADAEAVIAGMEQGQVTPSGRFWRQVCTTMLSSAVISPAQRQRLERIKGLMVE